MCQFLKKNASVGTLVNSALSYGHYTSKYFFFLNVRKTDGVDSLGLLSFDSDTSGLGGGQGLGRGPEKARGERTDAS